jgi:RNA polymerase sigma factor (sigma-70 family)
MIAGEDQTLELLQRWHRGEQEALKELLRRELPWIRERLHHRLGDALRQRGDTEDYLHDVVLEVMRYTPAFLVGSNDTFRRVVTQISENLLRDKHDFYARRRRTAAREQPLDTGVLCLDARARSATSPTQGAARNEEEAWVRFALDLLAPEDRDVIVMREYDKMAFAAIGAHLGIAENAARMRFQRGLGRLADKVAALRRGQV